MPSDVKALVFFLCPSGCGSQQEVCICLISGSHLLPDHVSKRHRQQGGREGYLMESLDTVLALYDAYAALLLKRLNLDLMIKLQNWEFNLPLSRRSSSTSSPMETCCLLLVSVRGLHAREQSSTWLCSRARRSEQDFPKDEHCCGPTKVKGVVLH